MCGRFIFLMRNPLKYELIKSNLENLPFSVEICWPVHQVYSFWQGLGWVGWPKFVYWDIKLNAHPQMPPQIGTKMAICVHFKSNKIFCFTQMGFGF